MVLTLLSAEVSVRLITLLLLAIFHQIYLTLLKALHLSNEYLAALSEVHLIYCLEICIGHCLKHQNSILISNMALGTLASGLSSSDQVDCACKYTQHNYGGAVVLTCS